MSESFYSNYKGTQVDGSVGAVLDAENQIGHGLLKYQGKLYIMDQYGNPIGWVVGEDEGGVDVLSDLSLEYKAETNQFQLVGFGGKLVGNAVIVKIPTLLGYEEPYLTLQTSSGEVLSTVLIKSAPEVDNKSINFKTNSSVIQAVGVIDSNDTETSIKTWTGTKRQYAEKGTYFAYTCELETIFVRTEEPNTSTTLYTDIGVVYSAYAISSVDLGSITLTNNKTYYRDVEEDLVDATQYDSNTLYDIIDDTVQRDVYTKQETYNKGEVNYLISTTKVNNIHTNKLCGQILELPRHILYTIDPNQQFVLMAGSTAIIPNGFEQDGETIKCLEVEVANNVVSSFDPSGAEGWYYILTNSTATGFQYRLVDNTKSGSTDLETSGTTFYNTATNEIISYNTDGPTIHNCSFPIAKVYVRGGKILSVMDTFNSMGSIGGTIWCGKGIKCSFPAGRDGNGDPVATEVVTDQYYTFTYTLGVNFPYDMAFLVYNSTTGKLSLMRQVRSYMKSVYSENYLPEVSPNNDYCYVEKENYWVVAIPNEGWMRTDICPIMFVIAKDTNVIDSIRMLRPAPILTRDDISEISGLSMPSDTAIDLTYGQSGSRYRAEANGYFNFVFRSVLQDSCVSVNASVLYGNQNSLATKYQEVAIISEYEQFHGLLLPVKAGDYLELKSYVDGVEQPCTYTTFRFIYATGEQL